MLGGGGGKVSTRMISFKPSLYSPYFKLLATLIAMKTQRFPNCSMFFLRPSTTLTKQTLKVMNRRNP